MIIGLPIVSALKRLRSAGKRHGRAPSLPIVPSDARATIRKIACAIYSTSLVTWPILRPGRTAALP